MFNPTRPGRFAPLWAVVVLVATVLSLAVNLGPAVAALVVPTAPTTAVAGAPAPVAAVGPAGRCEEDQSCWDPATMGNGLAGVVRDASGAKRCPARMVPWGEPGGVLCRSTVPGMGVGFR